MTVAQLTFDKLAYIDRLKAAGIDEKHARAHAEGLDQALREEVATKSDIASVKAEIAELRADTKADIAAVKVEIASVRADITELRADTKADITELRADTRAEIARMETSLIKWFVGTAIAMVTIGAAVAGFIFKHIP